LEDPVLDSLGEVGYGTNRQAEKTQLLEGFSGYVKPGSAAHFMFPVDSIQVSARVVPDSFACNFNQQVSFAEDDSLDRANRGAGRHPPFLSDDVIAKDALAHPGCERIMVFVGRDLKRARHHTVATTDTLGGVINHGAVIFFRQGAHDTRRDASRILTVHALDLDKGGDQQVSLIEFAGIITVYNGVIPIIRPSFIFKDAWIIK